MTFADKFSYLSNADIGTIDNLYIEFKKDPSSVEPSWKEFFEGFEFAKNNYDESIPDNVAKEFKVYSLIEGYRTRGHLFTKTNPVRVRRKYTDTISLEYHGLNEKDLDEEFQAGQEIGLGKTSLRNIIDFLETTYCRSIGVEYVYNRKPEQLEWLVERVEQNRNLPNYTERQKRRILEKLTEAVDFETFLHKKFVGQKRFSLEGGESLIPALDILIEIGASLGVKEVVMGMAHRGRLNVLANIFNKQYLKIFTEFEGKAYEEVLFDGDVKYHLGSTERITTRNGSEVKLTLAPNPSHLESVGAVVEGISRAKIDHLMEDELQVLPVIIHGDASIAGQGVVYEIGQMAQLNGYRTGGSVHIVINNQIGFTTNYIDGRSSTYCTDIGKVTLSPVFHVNGDDVESVVHAVEIALEFRQRFRKDVFIDLLGYRKYGHNEGDEPRFTQPLLYKVIAKHRNPREIYAEKLIQEKLIDQTYLDGIKKAVEEKLERDFEQAKKEKHAYIQDFMFETWKGIPRDEQGDILKSVNTKLDRQYLLDLAQRIHDLPEDRKFFRKIVKLFEERVRNMQSDKVDWAMAETLAYATLLEEGHGVRISGQDVERGTFSHRHAVLKIEDSEEEYIPLQHLSKDQGKFNIYNSLLSEYAVVGFEYGYSVSSPQDLIIWEAQFGDFANGAQIIFDQYLSAAEDKWKTMSGLVIFLPHGYEGQGAEHSSGRMERFLSLAAEDNMIVANCTTPANFYHLLRRQLKRTFRKPLVVFTPKSLLRHPQVISTVDEMARGEFQEVIRDGITPKNVKRVALVTGKLYYELLNKRTELKNDAVAIIRLEQVYPLHIEKLEKELSKYPDAELFWVQEEPENMGAWWFICQRLRHLEPKVISRKASGSPASGSPEVFRRRQEQLIDKVFSINE
jgi:2-oxoglutarate dehydrogenase E1 component